jgi:hypothetical protein
VTANRKPEWFFYPGWIVLSAISIPIAWALAWALISQIIQAVGGTIQVGGQTHVTEDFLLLYVFFPPLGLISGLLQYLLLRRYLPRMGGWVAATLLGWLLLCVALGLVSALSSATLMVDSGLSTALAIVLIGGSLALPQWLVLRRRVGHAAWWIVASVLGWGLVRLVAGGTISIMQDVIAVAFLPSAAASIAWWLLLDKLPQRESNGGTTPPEASLEPTAPVGGR